MLQDQRNDIHNHWDVWVFTHPSPEAGARQVRLLDPAGKLAKLRKVFPFAEPISFDQEIQTNVLLTSVMTAEVIACLQAGGRVLWFQSGDELNCRPYSLHPQVDYHATVVNRHPALGAFPHEGWCDMQFHNLIGDAVLDTGYFESNRLIPIIEAFHAPFLTHLPRIMPFRRKGFLAELEVGAGRILMTTFEFDHVDAQPEAAAMAHELLDYLLNQANSPAAHLTVNELREWIWGSADGAAETNFVGIGYRNSSEENVD
jgi:hypothetical protein